MTSNHFPRKQTINTETKPEPSQLKSKRIWLHHKQPTNPHTSQGTSFIPEVWKDTINLWGMNPVSSLCGCLLQETAELVARRWVGYHTGPRAFSCYGTTSMSFIVLQLQVFHQGHMKTQSAFELQQALSEKMKWWTHTCPRVQGAAAVLTSGYQWLAPGSYLCPPVVSCSLGAAADAGSGGTIRSRQDSLFFLPAQYNVPKLAFSWLFSFRLEIWQIKLKIHIVNRSHLLVRGDESINSSLLQ